MQKCAEYTGFVCTHWAFEEAEGECYVFDGCEAAHSDTYNTYLYDPQCQITKANGGCVDVRCEKDSNPYVKSCDKDNVGIGPKGEMGLCSLSRCERFCTDNRIPGGAASAQLGAHSPLLLGNQIQGDLGERHIFSGCKDMSTDTYVTYLYERWRWRSLLQPPPGRRRRRWTQKSSRHRLDGLIRGLILNTVIL